MRGFKFNLEKLLEIRIDEEEQSKIQFKDAQKDKLIVENRLHELKGNYSKYNVIGHDESALYKKIRLNYLNSLNNSIEETAEELEVRNKILDKKRSDLINKQVNRKTVEILKEKKLKQFVKEQELKEQNFIDELALYKYIRTERGGE